MKRHATTGFFIGFSLVMLGGGYLLSSPLLFAASWITMLSAVISVLTLEREARNKLDAVRLATTTPVPSYAATTPVPSYIPSAIPPSRTGMPSGYFSMSSMTRSTVVPFSDEEDQIPKKKKEPKHTDHDPLQVVRKCPACEHAIAQYR